MATTVTVLRDQIATCKRCGQRIAWLRSKFGKPYPVNMGSDRAQVRANDFHSCRVSAPRTQQPSPATAPTPLIPSIPPLPMDLAALLATPAATVLSTEELASLRRTLVSVMDIYATAYVRVGKSQSTDWATIVQTYVREMSATVMAQADAMAGFLSATSAASAVPAKSVEAELIPADVPTPTELDNASGPEPIPGNWTASDEDVPF
jgi:hypothetical protein